MCKVFISYRHEGGEYLAGRIYDYLKNNGISAFYDVESLVTGKFNEQLYEKIEQCDYFLMILPPQALDRCIHADDWFRLEIKHAIKYRKSIIPIMMPGFKFPNHLPDDIKDITHYQGFVVNNSLFGDQMKKLLEMIGENPAKNKLKSARQKMAVIIISCIVAVSLIVIGIVVWHSGNTQKIELSGLIPSDITAGSEGLEKKVLDIISPHSSDSGHRISDYSKALGMTEKELKENSDNFEEAGKDRQNWAQGKLSGTERSAWFSIDSEDICDGVLINTPAVFPELNDKANAQDEISIEDFQSIIGGAKGVEVDWKSTKDIDNNADLPTDEASSYWEFKYEEYNIRVLYDKDDSQSMKINLNKSYCLIKSSKEK